MAKRSSVDVPITSPRGHAEHTADVDERPERAVLEPEHGRLFARFVDDGILKERQRRKIARQSCARIRTNVAVDAAGDAPRGPRPRAHADRGTGRRSKSGRLRAICPITGFRIQAS